MHIIFSRTGEEGRVSSATCAEHFHSVLAFLMWDDYPHAIGSWWLSVLRAAAVTICGAVVAILECRETPGSQAARSIAHRQEDLHGLDLLNKKGVVGKHRKAVGRCDIEKFGT